MRLLHTMLRVGDLDRSIAFYTGALGMRLFRRETYPDGRFTLAFVGYGDEASASTIELTWNWDQDRYEHGTSYGHIALAVRDATAACAALEAAGATGKANPAEAGFAQTAHVSLSSPGLRAINDHQRRSRADSRADTAAQRSRKRDARQRVELRRRRNRRR